MPIFVILIWIIVKRTRFGLRLSACGEHPFAARCVGVSPSKMRLLALVTGGALCALGGADLALGTLHTFSVNMTAGRGFMGFAAVIFGAGDPFGSALAALFFSAVESFGIAVQIRFGEQVSQVALLALPYLATVLGLWLSAVARRRKGTAIPASEMRDY
jgi:simple sugar transport system permease protein